ncbi:hypothetical protein [uncultured Shewanella sp.]|uniref:hypothetical protein n=1 Tax=uncultured Shewanella sp. TaxID=173975 RepID=UPI0026380607|nr:hypothetical protein [uncultured Shewanella sp.]
MKGEIKNRVYRACGCDGFKARIQAELAKIDSTLTQEQALTKPLEPPLYSHHATRQSFFNKGWYAVTGMHILKAKQRVKQHAL